MARPDLPEVVLVTSNAGKARSVAAHPYPHLAPELRRLASDTLLLWADADALL